MVHQAVINSTASEFVGSNMKTANLGPRRDAG